MKKITLLALGLVLGTQVHSAAGAPIRYEVGERGANHKVWNKVTQEVDPSGQPISITNQAYVELAAGLHYAQGNSWIETKEEFTVVPGWALARKGPHKVGLAYNLNVTGAVAVELPDGRVLRSSVLSLHYLDKATGQSVRLAEITNCVGVVLPPNQVIYTNAFSGLRADVRFTYTRAGIEQDVILRQRPPSAEDLGLNAATTRLVVMTEFINPPSALLKSETLDGDQSDEEIGFGSMLIGRGRAFGMAPNTSARVPRSAFSVRKKWLQMNGRTFLMEQVPLPDVRAELDKLPTQASITPRRAETLVAELDMPAPRTASPSERPMEIAQVWRESSGFVMDYVQLNASLTNFTFQSNQTYYVSGRVDLWGATTFEGGAVIKCAPVSSLLLVIADSSKSSVQCNTSPYRPLVFTSRDDDSLGEIISDSSGSPAVWTYTNTTYLTLWAMSGLNVHDLRMLYGHSPLWVYASGGVMSNIQILHSRYPFYGVGANMSLRNVLLHDASGVAFWLHTGNLRIEHMTVDQCGPLTVNEYSSTIALTNSLLVGVQSLGDVPLTTNSVTIVGTNPPVFQSVGLGSHYLATNSPYRDVGTADINATLFSALQQMTTYPPPESYADTNTLDLGFHYPRTMDWDVDGLEDGWELQYFGNLGQVGSGDPDGDGLSNAQEFTLGTNPANRDTDGDGVFDNDEITFGRNPLVSGTVDDTNSVLNLRVFTQTLFKEPN